MFYTLLVTTLCPASTSFATWRHASIGVFCHFGDFWPIWKFWQHFCDFLAYFDPWAICDKWSHTCAIFFIRNGPIRNTSEILAISRESLVELSNLGNDEITFQILRNGILLQINKLLISKLF